MCTFKYSCVPVILFMFSFIFIQGCKDESDPVTPPSEHFDPEGWIIRDDLMQPHLVIWQGNIVTEWKGDQIPGSFFSQQNILSDHLNVSFIDKDSTVIDPPSDSDHTFGWMLSDSTIVFLIPDEAGGWGFHLEGRTSGSTTIELQVIHSGHVDIRTPLISIIVQ